MIFLDRACPSCHGEGCDKCHGTGMVGSVDCAHVSTSQQEPNSFSERMRAWRLEHGRTFRELSAETDIPPSVLSGIEDGRRVPTEAQMKNIEEVMMSELKPCPACGKPVELEGGQSWHDQHCFLIKCYECGCSRVSDTDKAEAIRRWNAFPRHLRWTKEPPTEPGWYWLRQASTKGLVQIVRACGEELPYNWEDAEWAGPIQEPVN